jgi:hypothetical protein
MTAFFALRHAGKFPLPPIKLGKSVRWRADLLEQWVAADCPGDARWRMLQQAGATGRRATG